MLASAIETVGAHAYSPEQIAVWSARHPGPERYIERHRSGDRIMVAVDETDRPVGYALLQRDGHLDHLYCHPDHTRRGLADRLLAAAEELARSLDVSRLYTEASELARPAFERAGYRVTHRRDFEIDGVSIHNFAIEKVLT